MEITVENLERAVSQFYHTDSILQAEAHQWLTAVQSSLNAWAVVWELLKPDRSAEAQFFAATTLHTKLMKNWSEVPSDQYGFLKNKLLESIVQYSSGPKIVLNRLCIALSAYLIQTTPHFWEDSLSEVISIFRPENLPSVEPERAVWILLEVLTVIPEEFQSMTLGQRHKNSVKMELEKAVPQVVTVVEGCVRCGGEVRSQGVKALTAWLHFGLPLPSCLPMAQSIVNSALSDPTTFGDLESDALSQMGTQPESHRHPSAVKTLVDLVLPLGRLTDSASTDDDRELLTNVYKVFVAIGEYHARMVLSWLAAGVDAGKALLRLILDCTSTPGYYPIDETHSQLTFGFWYILQDEVGSLPTKDEALVVREYLVPAYEQLSRALLAKSRLPPTRLSSHDAELFRCYRQDIADTMVYCYYVVHESMVSLLERTMTEASTWEEAEAVVGGALALAQSTQYDSRLVALLASVPPHFLENPRVVNTLNQAIGAYSEWLSGEAEALGRLIPGLVRSLDSSETATSATMALKDLTRECSRSLAPYAPHLLKAAQEALTKDHMRQGECIRLMYSIGRLLSLLPYDQTLAALQPIALDFATSIDQLSSQQTSPAVRNALAVRLRLAGTLLGTLYNEDPTVEPPVLLLLSTLLPRLATLPPSPDATLASETACLLKSALSSLTERSAPALPQVLSLLLATYNTHPNAPALDVARQVVILFGGSESPTGEMMVELLSSIIEATMAVATENGGNGASERSDVIQGFYNLVGGAVKRYPALLARSTDASRLFNFATISLLLPETATVKAAGSFLCNLIMQNREEPSLLLAVQNNGQQLLHTVIRCIAGECPRSGLDTFSEILLSLNKKHFESLSRWLPAAVSQSSGTRPSEEHKAQFIRAVLRERANKRKLQDTVREFAFICRGLITTDLSSH